MNDNLTISTFQLFKLFPDAESARVYLEARLWPNGPRCPICGLSERIGSTADRDSKQWTEAAFAACVRAYRRLQAQHPQFDLVVGTEKAPIGRRVFP